MLHQLRYIIVLLAAGVAVASNAQNIGRKIFTLPGEEGDEPKILTLYQNRQGYILAGTTKGLYRFDGINFFGYSQSAGMPLSVTSICQVNNNDLWLGYDNGNIGMLRNDHISLLHFEEGFPKVSIKKIIVYNNIVWIATAGEGIYYYQNKRLYNINADDGLSDNYVYDIIENANGIIAATDRGLNIVSLSNGHKNIQVYSSRNGLPDNIVRCLYPSMGSIWLGMQDAGIIAYSNDLEKKSNVDEWKPGQVNSIIATSSQVFVATEDHGLLVFDHDNKYNIADTPTSNDLQIPKVTCLLKDRENNIWAAGGNNLMRTAGSNMEVLYVLKKTTAEKIHCLLYAGKSIWFNDNNAVVKISRENGKKQVAKFVIPAIGNTDISSLYEDINGLLWVGTLGKGIVFLDAKTGKQTILKDDSLLINSNIISLSGKDSIVWISSFEGVIKVNLSGHRMSFTNYTDVKSIGSNYINYILEDSKSRVWFATDGKGITLFDKNKFSNFQEQAAKYGNVIYRIVEDPLGQIWYSTYKNGIVKYDGISFFNYTMEQGLSDLNINGLSKANDNIVVLHKNKLDIINSKTGIISYIDAEQGISNINTDLNAYTADDDGNVYFVSDSSICKYHSSYKALLQPSVKIDGMQLFLQPVQAENGHSFSYKENNISFYYTGLYYSQPEKIIYQYKLEGYDKEWIDTKDRIRNFPQLQPGSYTFRVRVSLNNNFSVAQEDSFMFVIEKPFWQAPWFIVLCTILLASTLYLFIKIRERSIDKFNRLEREKIRSQLETLRSQINPHFLFNSFNTLISEIEEQPDKAVTYVEKLSDFYRSIVMHREKDLIILREEIEILNDYAFIQQKRYGRAVQIINTVNELQASTFYITPLALQLLIENAIKHNVVSLENPLVIELFIDDGSFLVVRNNLTKKLQEEKGSRMGLQNIQKRYELLSKKAVIIEKTDKYFIVKIPLLKNAV